MKAFLIALLVFVIGAAHASEDSLFVTIPANTTVEQALNAVKYVALKRRWMIYDTGNNTLRIELMHRGYNAVLNLSIAGDEIHYSDSTTYLKTDDDEETYGPSEDTWELAQVPKHWLRNLQNDTNIYFYLGIKQIVPVSVRSSSENIESKLETLKSLLEANLISKEEYEQKRKELISNF